MRLIIGLFIFALIGIAVYEIAWFSSGEEITVCTVTGASLARQMEMPCSMHLIERTKRAQVDQVWPSLFEKYPDAEKMLKQTWKS